MGIKDIAANLAALAGTTLMIFFFPIMAGKLAEMLLMGYLFWQLIKRSAPWKK